MGSYMPTRRRFTKISSIWSSWWTHPMFVTRWLYLSATNPRPHCWLIYKSSYNFQMVHKLTEEENEMSDLKRMIYLWVELHKLKSIYFSLWKLYSTICEPKVVPTCVFYRENNHNSMFWSYIESAKR
jgi:hypothetical protein